MCVPLPCWLRTDVSTPGSDPPRPQMTAYPLCPIQIRGVEGGGGVRGAKCETHVCFSLNIASTHMYIHK